MKLGALTAVAFLALVGSEGRSENYTVLTSGRPTGMMTVTGPATERTVRYRYDDRGRGPDLTEIYRAGADGRIDELRTTGVDYLKAPVDERFRIEGGTSSWSSSADEGTSGSKSFYVTYQRTPEDAAALLRALLNSPSLSLRALPNGTAQATRLLDLTVDGPAGAKATVTLYAVSGLGMAPTVLWLDQGRELFFSGSTWLSTIRKDWESAAPQLIEAQDQALRAREFEAAARLQRRPAGPVVIRHALLFNAKSRRMRPNMSVVVRGNRIVAVGRDAVVRAPPRAEVIDARGRALLPGLWDMHVHISDNAEGLLNLAGGVTNVRDMGDDIDQLAERRALFDSGRLAGPRIWRAGLIDGRGPLAAPVKTLASTPEEVVALIDRYASLGYEQIKIYSSFDPKLVALAVKTAHQRGLRISGHIPAGMIASQAVDDGFDEIQHVNFIMLNFWPDVAGETAGMARFKVVGERGYALDLNSPPVQAFLRKLHDRHIVVDPTVATFEGMLTAEPRKPDPSLAAALPHLPPDSARFYFGGGLAKTEAERVRYRASFAKMVAMVGALHRAGVTLVPGTDGLAGFLLDREFELWAKAGIPNRDILYAATLGAASVNHHQKDLGSIEPGKLADLVLIGGDPSRQISDIRKVDWVMKDGVIFDPRALHAALGIHDPQLHLGK